MVRKYFGTDGIRGRANGVITPELALKVGQAAGVVFRRGEHRHRVVIGKDTRLSGYMIETALVAGFTSVGMDVLLLGPMPTPAVAMLTRSMRADLGVMISASHNPYDDNGIKLFGPDGYKLSDEVEHKIEALIDADITKQLGEKRGARPRQTYRRRARPLHRIRQAHDAAQPVARRFARRHRLRQRRRLSRRARRAVGAWRRGRHRSASSRTDLTSTASAARPLPTRCARKVREMRADIGIALDGDADRVVIADEHGHLVDGDQLLAVIAESWAEDHLLTKPGIVGTVMSNLGLERHLQSLKLSLVRTPVGDRYVLEHMREHGYNVGGEQSGHIILSNYTTTGDGFIAALQLLAVVKKKNKPVSEVCHRFELLPQVLRNVRYRSGKPLENSKVRSAIADAENRLNGHGRLVVRPSGTEPVIRVMGEGDDKAMVEEVVDGIVDALTAHAV